MAFVSTRNNYFAIPDILAGQERVTCVFNRRVPFLGVLDPSSEGTYIEQGTVLELPFWLAQSLFQDESITMELPKSYRESCRDIYKADASVVDLHRQCKYFYEFGKLLSACLDRRSALELCNTLIQVFIDRFRRLSDWAQNLEVEHGVTEKLDNFERTLLQRGRKAQELMSSWLSQGVGTISTSELVSNYKKRKLIAQEFSNES